VGILAYQLRVENIVASIDLGTEIPLPKLVSRLEGEYEPEQFPGLVYRLKEPRAAALIFSSGKVVCTGARSIRDVNTVFDKISDVLKEISVPIPKELTVQIENIVASAKLERGLNLNKIAFGLPGSEYEPDQFPGLVLRLDEPKVVFLLFASGKMICTGGRSIKDVRTAVKTVADRLDRLGAFIKE
jgi:transcription initiation factor TFIID TATA-box-binding protein